VIPNQGGINCTMNSPFVDNRGYVSPGSGLHLQIKSAKFQQGDNDSSHAAQCVNGGWYLL
jgi:hypothetical protein